MSFDYENVAKAVKDHAGAEGVILFIIRPSGPSGALNVEGIGVGDCASHVKTLQLLSRAVDKMILCRSQGQLNLGVNE